MSLFQQNPGREEILKRVGNISQLAGTTKMAYQDGQAKDTSAIRVRNGLGLDFTVIPDRGMDILDVYYRGIPLAWISKNGLVHPGRFDDKDFGWLRSFGGGMLTTCGLRNVGPPVDENGEHFGLHGRISSIPASNVNTSEKWIGDDFYIETSGMVREANTFGENLVLNRNIAVNSRHNEILIQDRIVNEGFRAEPLMLLYHLNWGSPLLSADSNLLIDPESTLVRDRNAEPDSWNEFFGPQHGKEEIVYYHKLHPAEDHTVSYELHNQKLGVGIKVSWDNRALPCLNQWKMLGEGEYVLGLEPANCRPGGRLTEIKEDRGDILQPMETKEVSLKIEFLDLLN